APAGVVAPIGEASRPSLCHRVPGDGGLGPAEVAASLAAPGPTPTAHAAPGGGPRMAPRPLTAAGLGRRWAGLCAGTPRLQQRTGSLCTHRGDRVARSHGGTAAQTGVRDHSR